MPAAVLFDMDGTLVDTEAAWSAASGDLARAHGVPWTRVDDERIVGWSIPRLADDLRARGVDLPTVEIIEVLHRAVARHVGSALPWCPGAPEVLAAVLRSGTPVGLVTATFAVGITSLLEAVTVLGDGRGFAAVVTGDAVTAQKPDAEPYLLAARRLGVDPADCVVVEDSLTGVTAGLASGALTWCVAPGTALPAALAAHPRLRRVAGLPGAGELLGHVER